MEDDRDVREANEAFYQAFRDRDLAAMQELWAKDIEVSCVHPGWDVVFGREEVLDSWRRILANPGSPRLMASAVRVQRSAGIAVVTCHEGEAGTVPGIVATNVFVREHGRWRMLSHHAGPLASSPVRPPAETRVLN
ncbi:MAG: nuclear transport factor 2 family protein [Sandaracinaceae bacterium]